MSRCWIRGGVVGVELPVRDPRRSIRLLVDCLGFEEREDLVVDNGALRLRLVAEASDAAQAWLEVETDQLAADAKALEARDDVLSAAEAVEVDGRHVEQRFQTTHGLGLVLIQELTEDDREEPAPLPSSMDWCADADHLVRVVLRRVPLTFRDAARRRVTERAEALALAAGSSRVEQDRALRALFDATPDFQHDALREALKEVRSDGADRQ